MAANGTDTNDGPTDTVILEEVFVEGELPTIPTSNTVAAKLPLALVETPASVGVVDAETMEEQDSFVLGDALRNVAGVNVHPGSGIFDFFVLRGLDSLSSGLILTDGAPEPESTSYQLYNVERVEVLKGPAAFLYGGGPLGGAVNMVRKRPGRTSFTEVELAYGSFDTYEAAIDTNWSGDRVSFRLNGVWQESDLYRDDQESSTFAINPSFAFRIGERTSVNVDFEFADIEYTNDQGLPLLFDNTLPDVPRTRSYQSPFDESDQEATRIQVDIEHRFSDRLVLRNKTYLRELDWLTTGTTFNGVFPSFDPSVSGLVVSRNLTQLDDVQEFTGNQLELLWQAETGGVTHNLLFGLEIAQRTDEFSFNFGFLPDIALLDPVETAQAPFLFPAFGADATSDIVAPYIVDQISFGDKFQLLLGVRYDRIDFEDTATGVSREDDEVSPMAGVVFMPTENLSLYASYGEAFAPQSTLVVGQGQNREPESSEQVELGLKRTLFGGQGQWSMAVYQVDRENIGIPDQTGILQQTGDQTSEGFEFTFDSEIGPGARLSFTYAYTDAELTEFREVVQFGAGPTDFFVVDYSGNSPAYTPEHLANLWLSQDFRGGWGIAGGARYVGEQFIDENNAFELEDFTVFDAVVFYDTGDWRLSVNLRNLSDEEYFTRAALGNSVIPVAGFNAFGSLRFRF